MVPLHFLYMVPDQAVAAVAAVAPNPAVTTLHSAIFVFPPLTPVQRAVAHPLVAAPVQDPDRAMDRGLDRDLSLLREGVVVATFV